MKKLVNEPNSLKSKGKKIYKGIFIDVDDKYFGDKLENHADHADQK